MEYTSGCFQEKLITHFYQFRDDQKLTTLTSIRHVQSWNLKRMKRGGIWQCSMRSLNSKKMARISIVLKILSALSAQLTPANRSIEWSYRLTRELKQTNAAEAW